MQVTPLARDGRVLVTFRLSDAFNEDIRDGHPQRPDDHVRLRRRAAARLVDVARPHDRPGDGHGDGALRQPHAALLRDPARGRPPRARRHGRSRGRGARLADRRSTSCRSSAATSSSATPSTTSASARTPCRATPRSSGRGNAASPGSRSSRSCSDRAQAPPSNRPCRSHTSTACQPSGDARSGLAAAATSGAPFRDNPRLVLLGIVAADRRARRDGDARRPLDRAQSRLPQRGRPLRAVGRRPDDAASRWSSCWRATSSSWSSSGAAGCRSRASAPSWCWRCSG